MDTYYLDDNGFFIISDSGVELDFYEFLSIDPSASKDAINFSFNSKKRMLEYSNEKGFITKEQYLEEKKALDRINACLLYDERNRKTYDERIKKIREEVKTNKKGIKKFLLVKTNKEHKAKKVNSKKLKKIIIKIIIGTTTLVAVIGCSATVIDNYVSNDKKSESLYTQEVSAETYSDADARYSFRYKVVYGDTISGIAEKFGVSESDINREVNKNSNILNEGETIYITTNNKALADAQEKIYNENNNVKSR